MNFLPVSGGYYCYYPNRLLMKNMKLFFWGIFFLLFTPISLLAQGFQVNLQGQKQSAMAGGGAALILDESTIFFNPGAMSFVDHNAVSGGINPLWFKSAFNQSWSNIVEHVENHIATPLAVYGLWGPTQSKWKVGLGVYTPFGGLVDWGNNWSGKYTVTSLNLKAIYIQPTFSYQLTENLGVGAGFVYNHGEVDLQRALPINHSDGTDASAQLTGTGAGYGWNAGIYYRMDNGFAISLVHRSKVITKLENGDAIFNVPESVRSNFPVGNTFNAELPLPSTTTLAFGYPINENTSLALDLSFVNWEVYKELAFDYAENTPILEDTRSERNYSNGGSAKLGVQHRLNPELIIRAGAAYVLTPVEDGYVTPEAPDADRMILSAGFGYEINQNWELNASFLYESIFERTQTNLETGLSGTFKTHVYAPGISIGYKW